jgi:hypothetical protein
MSSTDDDKPRPSWYGTRTAHHDHPRGPRGEFTKGNPGGAHPYAKELRRVNRMFRETLENDHPDAMTAAVAELVRLSVGAEREEVRLAAISKLMDRHWGRVPQDVNLNSEKAENTLNVQALFAAVKVVAGDDKMPQFAAAYKELIQGPSGTEAGGESGT